MNELKLIKGKKEYLNVYTIKGLDVAEKSDEWKVIIKGIKDSGGYGITAEDTYDDLMGGTWVFTLSFISIGAISEELLEGKILKARVELVEKRLTKLEKIAHEKHWVWR